MFWLSLLAVITVLMIVLRRVLRRQTPLDDELYSKKVAVEHVHSGVAWVKGDGRVGSVNHSFARTFRSSPEQLVNQIWLTLFPEDDRNRAHLAYSQMLLAGIDSFECVGLRADGSVAWLNVRLVAVHDHHMRFVGHHCLVEDRTHEHELELRLSSAEKTIAERSATTGSAASEFLIEAARRPQKSPGAARV